MAAQVLSGADLQRTLNEEVDPVIREEVTRRVTALKLFKLKTVPVSGKYYRIVVKYGGNFYGSGRAEMGKLPGMNPVASYQDRRSQLKTLQLLFYKRYFYTTVDMTGQVRNAPATDSGGFGNLGKMIMDDTVENIKEMVSQRYAGGQFGVYGKIASVSNNVVTMDPATVSTPFAGNRHFREGMVMDCTAGTMASALRTVAAGAKNRGRLVTAVGEDNATPTVTFDDLGTATTDHQWADNDHLVMFDSRREAAITAAAADYQAGFYQPQGIMDAIFNTADTQYTGAYYGDQDRTANRVLQSIHFGNSGTARVMSLDHLNLVHEQIEVDPNAGDAPNLIYTTPSVRRKFMGFLTPTVASSVASGYPGFAGDTPVRYNDPGSRGLVNVGVAGVEITTIGSTGKKILYTDPLAPSHRAYLANTKTMMILQDRQPGFIDDDGQTLRMEEGTDSFFAGWKWYQTGIINWHPRKSGYLSDCSGDHLSA